MGARIVDTASFIRRAIELHGDVYDYSVTEFISSRHPITIICKEHGPFKLSSASSHTNRGKLCGCRKCGNRKRALKRGHNVGCIQCGKEEPYRNAGLCKTCAGTKKARLELKNLRRAKEIESRKSRPCECCGGCINSTDVRKKYCSMDCRDAARRTARLTVKCCVCGKEKQVYESQSKGTHCCSNKCQKVFAARSLWSKRPRKVKLPVVYFDCDGLPTHNPYTVCPVLKRVRAKLSKIKGKRKAWEKSATIQHQWMERLRSRLTTGKYRYAAKNKHENVCALTKADVTWCKAIGKQLRYLRSRRSYVLQNPWKRKIANKLSNLKKRRRRINARCNSGPSV